jgi:hypothetical protein
LKVEKNDTLSDNDRVRELFSPKTEMNHFIVRRLVFKENLWEIATLPVRIFFEGEDDNPKYFDGRLHPFLLVFSFMAFLPSKNENLKIKISKKFLMTFAWLYIVFAFFSTDMRIRYIIPALTPLVILSVCGIYNLHMIIVHRTKYCYPEHFFILVIIFSIFIPNLYYLNDLYRKFIPLQYWSNQIDRDSYIERFRPEYGALKYSNYNLPSNAKILSVFGGNRRYYSNRDIYFNNELFLDIVKNSKNPDNIRNSLKKLGFTHLIINKADFDKYYDFKLSVDENYLKENLFNDKTKLIFTKNGFSIYSL